MYKPDQLVFNGGEKNPEQNTVDNVILKPFISEILSIYYM